MKINNISEVFLGVPKSREISKEKTSYCYEIINFQDLDTSIINNNNSTSKIYTSNKLDDSQLLRNGDILIKLFYPVSAIYIDQINANTIISSNFAVIRSNTGIDSKILFYLIKNKVNELNRMIDGKVIASLKISSIIKLDVNYNEDKKNKLASQLDFLLSKLKELEKRKIEIINKKIKFYGGKYGK